jgi:hypothetical protein
MATWKLSTEIESNFDGGVMRAKWLIGGVRIVKTKAMRNSLPFLYRYLTAEETTLCFIESENQLYKLINNPTTNTTTDADWELVNLGGTSTLTPIGTWDVNNLSPALSDAGAAGLNGNFYFITGSPTPDTITIPGLFGGQPVTVLDGNLVVSVGSQWIIVSNGSSWDSIDKPQSIIDYVNGIVIPHTHSVSDIVDMGDYLDINGYLKRSDTADHTVPFGDVPASAIIEKEFLEQWYYTKDEITDLINDLEDGGITTFIGLTDTPSDYLGQSLKLVRVNAPETALEFVSPGSLFWSVTGDTTLAADVSIIGGFKTTFASTISKIALNAGSIATDPSAITTSVGDFWYNSTVDAYSGRTAIGGNVRFTYIAAKVNNAIPFFSTLVTQSPIFEQTNQFTYNNSTSTLSSPNVTISGTLLVGATSATENTKVYFKGGGNSNTTFSLVINNSDNIPIFRVRNDGVLSLGEDGTMPRFYRTTDGSSSNISGSSLVFSGVGALTDGTPRFNFQNTSLIVPISGNVSIVGSKPGAIEFAPASGNATFTYLQLAHRLNTTGTYTGTTYGIDYNPSLTSTTGLTHIAMRLVSGRTILGGTASPSARLQVRGEGITTGVSLRIEDSSANTRLTMTDAGTVVFGSAASTETVTFQTGGFRVQAVASITSGDFVSISNTFSYSVNGGSFMSIAPRLSYATTAAGNGLLVTSGSTNDGLSQITSTGIINLTRIQLAQGTSTAYNGTYNLLSISSAPSAGININAGTSTLKMISINPSMDYSGTVTGSFVYGIDYSPTFTSATGITHIAARFTTGIVLIGGPSPTYDGSLDVRPITGRVAKLGYLEITSDSITPTNTGVGIRVDAANRTMVFTGSGSAFNSSDTTNFTFGTGNTLRNSQDTNLVGMGTTWTPSSGTSIGVMLHINPNINTTGTYTGTFYGINYNPTLTSTTGLTHIAARFGSGQVLIGGSAVTVNTRLDVRGIASGDIARFATDGNTVAMNIRNSDGAISIGPSNVVINRSSGSYITSSISGTTLAFVNNVTQTATGFAFGISIAQSIAPTFAGVISNLNVAGGVTFAPISNSTGFTSLAITPIYNTTGAYSGTVIGIDYNPALTSVVGATHLAARFTSGQIVIGSSTATASTRLDIRGISGGNALRIASDVNGLLFIVTNSGNIGFFGTSPVSQQVSGANLTNNVTAGGTNDQIDDITDLTSYGADSATIRNNIYQLSRKLKQVNDALRAYGLLT